MMRIKLINPGRGLFGWTEEYCKQYWDDVDIECPDTAPESFSNRFDVAVAGGELMRQVQKAERDGYDAVTFTCHGDPHLSSAREGVHIPVVGLMEASAHVACMVGTRFTILSPNNEAKQWLEEIIAKYGLSHKLASVRSVKSTVSVDEVLPIRFKKPWPKAVDGTVDIWAAEAIKAVEEDEANVIVFGCGLYIYLHDEIIRRIRDKGSQVPVLKPLHVGIEAARAMVKLGISHSPIAYPYLEML